MVSRNATYRASNGPVEIRLRSILRLPKALFRILTHQNSPPFSGYLPPRPAASSWRLCTFLDSIQLMAPEFFERKLFLPTRKPRLGLPITLVSIVVILHVHFLHIPGTGLESFLARRNRPGVQPGERRGGPFHTAFVLRFSPTKRYVITNCEASWFRVFSSSVAKHRAVLGDERLE